MLEKSTWLVTIYKDETEHELMVETMDEAIECLFETFDMFSIEYAFERIADGES